MELITINIPEKWVAIIDQMVGDGVFANRSEAIRHAIFIALIWPELFKAAMKYKFAEAMKIDHARRIRS